MRSRVDKRLCLRAIVLPCLPCQSQIASMRCMVHHSMPALLPCFPEASHCAPRALERHNILYWFFFVCQTVSPLVSPASLFHKLQTYLQLQMARQIQPLCLSQLIVPSYSPSRSSAVDLPMKPQYLTAKNLVSGLKGMLLRGPSG